MNAMIDNDMDGAGGLAGPVLRRALRPATIATAIVSVILWLLRLGMVLYALLLFNMALPSFSVETLFGLFALAIVLAAADIALSRLRASILVQSAATIDHHLASEIFDVDRRSDAGIDTRDVTHALDSLRRTLTDRVATASIDALAAPLFVAILFGLAWPTALAMLLLLVAIVATMFLMLPAVARTRTAALSFVEERASLAAAAWQDSLLLATQGMSGRVATTLRMAARRVLDGDVDAIRTAARAELVVRALVALALLLAATLTAWRAIGGQADAGTIVATLLLCVYLLLPYWTLADRLPQIAAFRAARRTLRDSVERDRIASAPVALPRPSSSVEVENLGVVIPGQRKLHLQQVSFSATSGDIIAMAGHQGVGKTALLLILANARRAATGTVRLDGSTLDQWAPEALARHVGYLPQPVDLIEGSIAQNIARFDPAAHSASIIAAAQAAGVHDMIVRLAQGYDTPVGPRGGWLSASERQQVGLARAFYGDPFLILLDDPTAFLDPHSCGLLSTAIQRASERGAIVIGTGSAPAVIDVANILMVLRHGRLLEYGPAEQVRERMSQRTRSRIDATQGSTKIAAEPAAPAPANGK
jgi:ABC-type protease/lipase transport system fused ATPase/permease subunit